jgi:hypothetical protein
MASYSEHRCCVCDLGVRSGCNRDFYRGADGELCANLQTWCRILRQARAAYGGVDLT